MTTPAAQHPRVLEPRLREALDESPVTLLHGPRQCGKTTLARKVGAELGYAYFSFDDAIVLGPAGVVLYDGEATVRFGEVLFAVPFRSLWESV